MIDALPADALRTRFDPSDFGFETTDDLPAETEVVGQDRAVEEADLVALGKTSTQSSRRRLGTTSEALPAESSAPVLVLRRAPRRCPPALGILRRFGDGPAGPAHGGRGLFVMPGTGSPLVDASLQRFLYELDRPLLLVR
ncbi:hypothetical protein [Salinibacter ruber]|uniref:hypothetical protein n=1 Tax=Salinibacter ruber TaxID=146919 RepID=UPI001F0763D9|nr:hypothetical protein [Salinibacter ruber]